ncbi:uncharacterized protein J4E78_008605 [Alternaria triticimaculans]|uniref:uncharacterized protein n=1 Tax=Alternaria triticimaculans TaxID=297637 RepID=UPI0020C23462|nr:uncharacterized protein J4E78_008605 [Alternaria triticimaculans]KAI4648542.1 hypothetical protein J4E78_008605 [Alternaria triticimaculans]
MSDYIDDFDFSSLSIDDIIDIAFGSPDGTAAFESVDTHLNFASSSDPPSSGMPRVHFDNPSAAPFLIAQPNPPVDADAMMNEHLLNGVTLWSPATPSNQRSHHAFTPCDTVFA